MAEFAQRSIEEMLVEAEKMKKIGLFTHEEIRAIMKKRKRFEYKMQRRTKEKDVYLQYIQYEIGVYQLIKRRREKKRIELGRDEIDKAVALRIYKLFRIACFRFKSDTALWLTHIEFAKNNMDKERVSKIFTTMLQVHNKKSNFWIMAAKFELETNESVETARLLFQRALRFLPHSRKIWIEYFKMELLCVELVLKRKELLGISNEETEKSVGEDEANKKQKLEDAILNCKVVEVVFRNAIKQVKENIPDLIHQFILIAMKFKFANNLVEKMYNILTEDENLKSCEESWDVLARRNLLEEEEILKKCTESGQVADFTIAEFEEKANEAYMKALNELKTKKMHEIYIEFCSERLQLNSKYLNEDRFNRLNKAYEIANEKFGLSLNHSIEWIELLIKFDKVQEAFELIEKNLVDNNSNSRLWTLYLKLKINLTGKHNENELIDSFYKSIKQVKTKESLNIWQLIIEWALLNNYSKIEKIFQEGSQTLNKEIATFCRCKYLNWSLQNSADGLNKMRQIYKSLRQSPPYDLNFYLKYIEFEKFSTKVNEKLIESAYEDALIHFDKDNIDLWLSYIEFEYSKSNKNTEYVADLYKRALRRLDNDLVEEFTQKFVLLKINLNHLINTNLNDVEMD